MQQPLFIYDVYIIFVYIFNNTLQYIAEVGKLTHPNLTGIGRDMPKVYVIYPFIYSETIM